MILSGREVVQKKEGDTKKENLEASTKSGEVAALRMKALPAILNAAKSGAWDSLDGGDKGSPNPGDGEVKEPQCAELCLHILRTCVHSPPHMCTCTHSHTTHINTQIQTGINVNANPSTFKGENAQ